VASLLTKNGGISLIDGAAALDTPECRAICCDAVPPDACWFVPNPSLTLVELTGESIFEREECCSGVPNNFSLSSFLWTVSDSGVLQNVGSAVETVPGWLLPGPFDTEFFDTPCAGTANQFVYPPDLSFVRMTCFNNVPIITIHASAQFPVVLGFTLDFNLLSQTVEFNNLPTTTVSMDVVTTPTSIFIDYEYDGLVASFCGGSPFASTQFNGSGSVFLDGLQLTT
jgi:hypothetical protein